MNFEDLWVIVNRLKDQAYLDLPNKPDALRAIQLLQNVQRAWLIKSLRLRGSETVTDLASPSPRNSRATYLKIADVLTLDRAILDGDFQFLSAFFATDQESIGQMRAAYFAAVSGSELKTAQSSSASETLGTVSYAPQISELVASALNVLESDHEQPVDGYVDRIDG